MHLMFKSKLARYVNCDNVLIFMHWTLSQMNKNAEEIMDLLLVIKVSYETSFIG